MNDRNAPSSSYFRRRLDGRQTLVGTFVKSPGTQATEIVGGLGYDFVVIDQEHAPLDRTMVDLQILATRAAGIAGLVRIPAKDPAAITTALDCGATGVLIPHVATVEDAQAMAAAARFRGGRRGYSNSPRSADYGRAGLLEYIADQDESVCVIAMIEDVAALEVIDAIAATEGIHGLFIGRGDLTVAFQAGARDDDRVRRAVGTVMAAARRVAKPVCVMVSGADEAQELAQLGASVFIISSDQGHLRRAARETLDRFDVLCPGQRAANVRQK